MNVRCYTLLLVVLLILPGSASAQEADTLTSTNYDAERSVIESALGTVVKVIKTATFRDGDDSMNNRLHDLAARLNAVNQSLNPTPATPFSAAVTTDPEPPKPPPSITDLQELEDLLNELYNQVRDIRTTLQAEENYELAEQLAPVENGIDNAVVQTRRLIRNQPMPAIADAEPQELEEPETPSSPWLEPGSYEEGRRRGGSGEIRGDLDEGLDDMREGMRDARSAYREAMDEMREGIAEARDAVHVAVEEADPYSDSRRYYRYREPRSPFDDFDYADAYVGEFYNRWPYRETALYRPIPAIRYNRVEGLVLGARLLPLEWGDWDSAKIYGQAGYAFELKKARYEVGAEIRPFPYASDDYDFKIGGAYRRNTATNDTWKMNWVENTIAALLFEYDYLDYYQVDGFSLYAIQRLSSYAQFSIGYRSETYSSLDKESTWSLFGGHEFRLNPGVNRGLMNSMLFTLEGGQLSGLYSIPRGFAFRFEGELGDSFGGDFSFNRFLGDMRVYMPFGFSSSFAIRTRAGYASDNTPIQKMFTLGGIGSVRAYPQNVFFGTRMLLANVEYTIAHISPLDDIFADVQVFGFGDAGWVNTATSNEFDFGDVFPAAGVGLSFADRSVRLELAWPLKDVGGQRGDPTLWLRLTPTF